MNSKAKLLGAALSVSFLGSLPLGTLNSSVAAYAFRHDWPRAAAFSLAAISVEVSLVRIALMAIGRLEGLSNFFRHFRLLSAAVLLILAGNSLLAAWQMQTFRAGLPFSSPHPFLSGFLLSLANPLHLPFWMGWITILRSKKILGNTARHNNIFIIAIGLGTALGFTVYALAGGYLISFLGNRQVLLNWAVGITLLIAALAQLRKRPTNKIVG